jgi:beta-xylosidase
MKKLIITALSLTLCTAMTAQKQSGNPVFEGWYADPEGAVFDNEYWIFPTYSAAYNEQLHFDAFSSKDLVTWQKHERILTNKEITWAWQAMWAPSVVENNGKYFFFFGANDIQSNSEPGGIGVAVADSPAGPYRDLLGKPLIDKIINGAQPIDQFAFKDSDGKWYLIYGGWGHCNIVLLADDFRSVLPFPDGSLFKEITPDNYVEGPFLLKRNGKYYFMWSEGGWGGPDYSVAYAIGDSPFGPWKRIGKILQQDPAIATGAGHHSVIKGKGKDEYYIIYHRRPLGDKGRDHRVTCIDKLTFGKDGKIVPVKMTFEGVKKRKL